MYYNSTEKETKLKKRRYTREAQLTFVKEGIIPFSSFIKKSSPT
jgi:hypothetical protein